MTTLLEKMGACFLSLLRRLGHMFIFLMKSCYLVFVPPFKFRMLMQRIRFFGNRSLLVILLTGAFTGMVLALQIYYTLRKVGSEAMLGPAVAVSIIRELGPVLCGLMITGRAGSALAAEIGIMRITEQIDALVSMALNPLRYLIVPSIVAAVITFPLLTSIFDLMGIWGGYFVGVKLLGLSAGTYFSTMQDFVTMEDILIGLYKAVSFGVIVSWVSSYKGFYTDFGAEGVSRATTSAVVLSSVLILIWDYFLASLFV